MAPRRKVTVEVRREIYRLRARGLTLKEIAPRVGLSFASVGYVVRASGGLLRSRSVVVDPARGLSLEQRIRISVELGGGASFAAIANRIGRHRSSVWREVSGNGGRLGYRPVAAHQRAQQRALRPKPMKLVANPELGARVISELKLLWSPQQIAARLRAEFGEDKTVTVSHETIYRSIYVQGRGALRAELSACLRTGRAARVPRGRLERRGRIQDMINISERPAEVADRAVPGHWEGDLILGADNRSAVGTLVERSTRFVMLLHLPANHGAEAVRDAMTAKIQTLPLALRRSITWDQGVEMSQHARFTVDTGVNIYFCDPHSPWQRGSNENTNGLLRQYLPKSTDLSCHSEADLTTIADSLNSRPRETLGWKTPSETLNAVLVALTV
jgi:IS30 family transposase